MMCHASETEFADFHFAIPEVKRNSEADKGGDQKNESNLRVLLADQLDVANTLGFVHGNPQRRDESGRNSDLACLLALTTQIIP